MRNSTFETGQNLINIRPSSFSEISQLSLRFRVSYVDNASNSIEKDIRSKKDVYYQRIVNSHFKHQTFNLPAGKFRVNKFTDSS